MLEKEILKLLSKISLQLEDISCTQQDIKREIQKLHHEFAEFQSNALELEEKIPQGFRPSLN